MGVRLRVSPQTLNLLAALLARPAQWHHGYALSQVTGIASGTLYPILMRLEKLRWLETRWEQPGKAGRPPRHHRSSDALPSLRRSSLVMQTHGGGLHLRRRSTQARAG